MSFEKRRALIFTVRMQTTTVDINHINHACIPMCVCSEDVFSQKPHIPSAKEHCKFRIGRKFKKISEQT